MFFIMIFIALCHLVDSVCVQYQLWQLQNFKHINRCYSNTTFHVFLIHDWIMEDLMMMHRTSCLVTHFKMEGFKQT